MEDIFIQALITRSYNETDLLDKLPEDIKLMVEDKLSEFNEEMEHEVETEEIVPEKISSRQLRSQLILQGFNLETIEQALNQLPEPNRSLAKVDWEYATNFYRNNAMIVAVGQLLQLTEEQIDNIFIQGALL